MSVIKYILGCFFLNLVTIEGAADCMYEGLVVGLVAEATGADVAVECKYQAGDVSISTGDTQLPVCLSYT